MQLLAPPITLLVEASEGGIPVSFGLTSASSLRRRTVASAAAVETWLAVGRPGGWLVGWAVCWLAAVTGTQWQRGASERERQGISQFASSASSGTAPARSATFIFYRATMGPLQFI